MAVATASPSPCALAYKPADDALNSVNSFTMSVVRSHLASKPAACGTTFSSASICAASSWQLHYTLGLVLVAAELGLKRDLGKIGQTRSASFFC